VAGEVTNNEFGYGAKRIAEESSMIGLDVIDRYTSTFLDVCMRNCSSSNKQSCKVKNQHPASKIRGRGNTHLMTPKNNNTSPQSMYDHTSLYQRHHQHRITYIPYI
jgi:hypothetical protein